MVWGGTVFNALGTVSDGFWMDFVVFGDQRSLWGLREQIFRMCEANSWTLDAPVATFGQHIIDLGGRRGAPGGS